MQEVRSSNLRSSTFTQLRGMLPVRNLSFDFLRCQQDDHGRGFYTDMDSAQVRASSVGSCLLMRSAGSQVGSQVDLARLSRRSRCLGQIDRRQEKLDERPRSYLKRATFG
jgi:hypothetical protein